MMAGSDRAFRYVLFLTRIFVASRKHGEDRKRRAMTQPVMEATAFSGNVEFGLPQENDPFE